MKTIKKCKSLILNLVLVFSLLITPFANTTITLAEENEFKIMGTVQNNENNIRLDWTELQSANYQLYQSVDGKAFQTMSTFDTTSTTDKVKVLQIYPISVTQASTFSVIIPKTIILDGSSGLGEYQVQTKGNVSGTASLSVVPNEFAIMKDVAGVKTSFNANVTQDKTLFNSNEIINNTITNGIVDASQHMTAGNWKGTFNFVITFSDENAKVNSIGSMNQYDDGINVGYDKEQEQSTAYSDISFIY